ncbi:MAG: toprim domain-containing protein [Firmicutes bacterium]|nr:toprim domain-containing protein [Bacillota bacterium]
MNDFEKVNEAVDIIEICENNNINFNKIHNNNYIGKCPFHDDNNPSFSVNKEKKVFNCFGCDNKGNAIQLYAKLHEISDYEAMKILANKYEVNINSKSFNYSKETNKEKKNIKKIYKNIARIAHNELLSNNNIAYRYLKDRKIKDEIIIRYELGYLNDKNNIYDQLLKLGFGKNEIYKTKLFNNRKFILNNRLLFPIFNYKNEVIQFSGRDLFDNDTAKYINSRNCLINKGNCLYNIENHDGRQKHKIIVEGYFDVLALAQSGINNSLAIMGKDITPAQYLKISNLTKKIILWLDNDKPQVVRATYKAYKELVDRGLTVKFVYFSDNEDPYDTCLKCNFQIKKLLKKSVINFDTYFLKTYEKLIDTSSIFLNEELSDLINEIASYCTNDELLNIFNSIERKHSIKISKIRNKICNYNNKTLESIGFKRFDEIPNCYYYYKKKYYVYALEIGELFHISRLPTKKEIKKYNVLSNRIIEEDNRIIIDKTCIEDVEKYIENLI